ncbi:hypothetical protein KIN20_018465 [Parelaphostrongylus tenuis]|uniref:Uncharacterized protein n=1 Tax=Parelaphostrongylus tenuis TaxID=148309 RepID=A0AAD5QUC7_PARTN|nr:hypothetical protein KIN20_018465 [Parelaphostrongylus tenuis]
MEKCLHKGESRGGSVSKGGSRKVNRDQFLCESALTTRRAKVVDRKGRIAVIEFQKMNMKTVHLVKIFNPGTVYRAVKRFQRDCMNCGPPLRKSFDYFVYYRKHSKDPLPNSTKYGPSMHRMSRKARDQQMKHPKAHKNKQRLRSHSIARGHLPDKKVKE